MHLQVKKADICQTCIHVVECAHHRNCLGRGETIMFCENFDDKPALRVVESEILKEETQRPEPGMTSLAYIEGRMRGLCTNCEKRVACRYPVREGGVWHCEEYC